MPRGRSPVHAFYSQAGFWQSVSRVFGQNLKSEYDAESDDRMLEQIVRYYEAGLL